MTVETNIPNKQAAPEEKEQDRVFSRKNLAGDAEICKEVLARAKSFYTYFQGQDAREKFEESMQKADEMVRLADSQSKQEENLTRDEVDRRPDIVYRIIRAVSSAEADVMVPLGDLPVKYGPKDTADDARLQEGRVIADQQNAVLEYGLIADDRRRKLRDGFFFLNKYGAVFMYMNWRYEERKCREKVVAERDEDGLPTRLEWRTVKKVEQYPEWQALDIKDTWFDCNVTDMQNQQCIIIRDYPDLSELVQMQASSQYMNVGNLTQEHAYKGESSSTVLGDRQRNAGESGGASEPTGAMVRFNVFIREPIDEESGKRDPEKYYPKWYWATFIGDLESGKSVCVRLIRLPFPEDEVPCKLWHALPDDKGAFHNGPCDLLAPAYDEYKTALDQWTDSKNTILNAPYVTEEGAIINDDKSFGPRKLIIMKRGKFGLFKRMEIPSVTNDITQHLLYLEERIKETGGASKALLGEAHDGRTTATEADDIASQQVKPSVVKMNYEADGLAWMAKWDMKLWRNFATSDLIIAVTYGGRVREVKPSELYGDLTIKVETVHEYEKDTMQRAEEDRLLSLTLDRLPSEMQIKLITSIYRRRGLPVDDWIPQERETDSRNIAKQEFESLQMGVWDEPEDGENHPVHIDQHKNDLRLYRLLPEADKEVVALVEAHIQIHEALQQNDKQQSAGQQANGGSGGGMATGIGPGTRAPASAGQMGQQVLGAMAGGAA